MDATTRYINLGEDICRRLKRCYYPDAHWSDCSNDVAMEFTKLKKIARKFYVDKDDVGVLMELIRYSDQDMADMMEKPIWISENQLSKNVANDTGELTWGTSARSMAM